MRVDLDQAESLMAAVGLFVGEVTAVLPPADSRRLEIDPVDLGLCGLLRRDVEEVELIGVEFVAGQWVAARLQFRPAAARR